jgi:hypothetical protein
MRILLWVGLLSALAMPGWAQEDAGLVWTAYNDQYIGPARTNYTTAWNIFAQYIGVGTKSSGKLMDSATGAALPVTLAVSSSGQAGMFSGVAAPAAGTPADALFGQQVDWTHTYQSSTPVMLAGGRFDYAYSNLDTNKEYRFAGSAVSDGSFGAAWTLVEISGAQVSTPAHSSGPAVFTNGLTAAQVVLNIGQNQAAGDYAAWDHIKPSVQGKFTIRCTRYGGTALTNGQFAFGLVGVRLQEVVPANTPVLLTEQPVNQTVVERSSVTFQGRAIGNPPPTYQWYLQGQIIPDATNRACTLNLATMNDNQAAFRFVAGNTVSNVNYMVTSQVATLTVLVETNSPILSRVLPPQNAAVSSLSSIEILFNRPVAGVTAADLLINGHGATNVTALAPEQYLFEFPQPPLGAVQVAWRTDQAIKDTSSRSNPFLGGDWTYNLTTNLYDFLRLNEMMAANKHGIRDEDGDYADWIEIYNSSLSSVPLTGCYLATDPAQLTAWQFPPFVMAPDSYLLVWASGKNRTNSTAPLHTNFKLNKDGSYLALINPDGNTIVSAFSPSYPPQRSDVSYGRDRTDPSLAGYFTTPTPNAPNATSGPDFGPDVRFSRDSGTFLTPFTLRLGADATNAVIHYAFGTNLPTAISPLYSEPLLITNTTQVRARSFVPGLFPGPVQSKEYMLLDTTTTNLTGFESSLPIVVIHNYGGGRVPVSENNGGYAQFALLQVFEPKNGLSSLLTVPDLALPCTIHRRGQATLNNAKANLRLEIQDENGGGKSVPLLGLPADNDWILYAIDGYDKVLMHNPLAHELYRQLGHYSPRTRYVEVYLKDDSGAPGPITAADYNGLYVLEEKIKISPDRVAIDKLQPENTNAPSITGGYLFSIDKSGPPNSGFWAAEEMMWYLDPNGEVLNTPQRAPQQGYLNNYLEAFDAALTGPDWMDPEKGYAAYIDVPAFIDFHMHQVLMFNVDMLRISTYYCKPRNGKLTPAALWDFDRAFGTNTGDDQRGFNPWRWRAGTMDSGTDPFNADNNLYLNPWYGRLFKDPNFWQQWIDRYQELRSSVYSSSNVTALIERLGNEIAAAAPREYARWPDTRPSSGTVSGDGWSYAFPIPGSWAGEMQFVKTWFTNRLTFMDTNFLARPSLSQSGGPVASGTAVTLAPASEPGSYVIYTLEGTDPRLPGGGLLTTALSNQGPVTLTITNNIRLAARSWSPNHRNLTGANKPPLSSPWSGPMVASYYLTNHPTLRITEIMYHPAAAPAGNPYDREEFEYVELTNLSGQELELAGYQIQSGIQFAFTVTNRVIRLAAGDQVLVVRNLAAFATRYPTLTDRVAGEYSGHLNNAGDRLRLLGPLGEVIQDITFDNKWYPVTDGLGFSLVARETNSPPNAASEQNVWRPSTYAGGSPGASDTAPISIAPVLVNEIQNSPAGSADDAVELWNPNAGLADLGYWYLTDDLNTPKKYLIPPGTTIPGFGFLVLQKTNSFGVVGTVNALQQTNTAFGLKAKGDEIYVFSGDASGQLTGYYHGFSYGFSLNGVTWGRYLNSMGDAEYVALSANTLGFTNAPPQVGPVIISELMFDPPQLMVGGVAAPNPSAAYVELHNLSSEAVPLYDLSDSNRTWHLEGGIEFGFPPGLTLPPQGYLLVVNFNPAADSATAQAFREYYHLATNVPLYGPFSGRLNPAGDHVTIRRPGDANQGTTNPSTILVDRVEYGVAEPWPSQASGTGASLHRKTETAFGDDPASWAAAAPSPGWEYGLLTSMSVAIELKATNVVISWTDTSATWQLEETTDLADPLGWHPATAPFVQQNAQWQATVPIAAEAHKYFRLRKP